MASSANAMPNASGNSGEQNSSQPRQPGTGPRRHRGPDFAAAAKTLGVSEQELIQALGLPAKPPKEENGRPSGPPPRPDIKGAAQRLGVSEEQLIKALGIPPRPPGNRPDGQPPTEQRDGLPADTRPRATP